MRKISQRITALALASAVAFSVLPAAAFAETLPPDAASAAAQTEPEAEAEPEAETDPAQNEQTEQTEPEASASEAIGEAGASESAGSEAASSEAVSSEAASSEAASSEAASSEAVSSEASSSEAASSEAADSEAASSEAASSKAASSEAADSEAASSEVTEDEQPADEADTLEMGESKNAVSVQASTSLELIDGKTTGREIYDIFGSGYNIFNMPKDTLQIKKGNDDSISISVLTSYLAGNLTLETGTYTVQKLGLRGWNDIGTLTVTVYHEITFTADPVLAGITVFSDIKTVNDEIYTDITLDSSSKAKCYPNDTLSFKVADVSNYEVAVTLDGAPLSAVDGVYTIADLDASHEVKATYTVKDGAKVFVEFADDVASIKVNGHEVKSGDFEVVAYDSNYQVTVTPKSGYALTEVTLDGSDIINDLTFNDTENHSGVVEKLSGSKPAEGTTEIKITAHAKEAKIVLNNDWSENNILTWYDGMDKASVEQNIIATLTRMVNEDETLPAIDDAGKADIKYDAGFTLIYDRWNSVDYTPGDISAQHKFGAKDTESVRVSFPGSARYPATSIVFDVNLQDNRIPTVMEIRDGYTVKYQATHEDMDAFVKNMLDQYVTLKNNVTGETIITGKNTESGITADNFSIDYDHNVGEQTLTIVFNGTDKYKTCSGETTITVTKGDATVIVNSQTINYGETLAPVFAADPSEAGVVGLIGGVKADGGFFVGLDGNVTINQLFGKNIPSINIPGVGAIGGDTPLKNVLMKDEFKLSELTSVIQKILDASASIGAVLPGNTQQVISAIQSAIDLLEKAVPGISNAVVSLNYPTEAGAYVAVGFTTNQNYNTAIGTGTIIIKQTGAVITVNSQKIKYGDTLQPVFSCNPAEANGVGIIAGLDANGGYYVGVKFCNEEMQKAVSGATTLKELASVLKDVPNADVTGLNTAVTVLSKVMPGIENTKISFDDPTEAGVYTAVGFVTNKNYKTAPVFGTIIIDQDSQMKKLAFNEELPESQTLTVSEAKDFNFGGHMVDLAVVDGSDAATQKLQIGVNAYYDGNLSDGTPYMSTTPCRKPGIYTETIFVIGTNYKVTPISRLYTIINDQITIYPVDAEKVYGDADPDFEITVITNGDAANAKKVFAKDFGGVSVVREPGEDVGSYQLTVKFDKDNLPEGDYTYRAPEDKTAYLNIQQREVTMEFADFTIAYGDETPAAEYKFLRGGEEDTVLTKDNFAAEVYGAEIVLLDKDGQIVADTTKPLDAGTYTYDVLYIPEGGNIKLTVKQGTLTVNPRSVYLQVKDASMTEGDNFPAVEYSFYDADEETGEKLDAVADWMSDELAEKITVSYADATQGPKLSAGKYDMSFDQIELAADASASNAKVDMSVSGLYANANYDVNLFTLNDEHTKLATLTVNKKSSGDDNNSGNSSNSGSSSSSSSNNNTAEEQTAAQQTAAVTLAANTQTGDNSSLLLSLAIMLASVLGLAFIWRKKI